MHSALAMLLLACAAAPGGARVDGALSLASFTPASGFDVYEHFLPGEATGEEEVGMGLTVADFDGDDRPDLHLPQVGTDQLYFQGDDLTFVLASAALPPDAEPGVASSAADYDADGDLDLFVANLGADRLLRNDGGVFAEEPGLAGAPSYHTGATWGDVDLDGDLDLAVLTHSAAIADIEVQDPGDPKEVWEQTEDGWVDHGGALSDPMDQGYAYAGGLLDLDGDGWLDLYMINDFGPEQYSNAVARGGGSFDFQDVDDALELTMYGMGAGVGDLNDDGLVDLLLSDWGTLHLMLSDGGDWYDAAVARGLTPDETRDQHVAWSGELADLDNDGDLDAVVNYGFSPGPYVQDGYSSVTGLPDAMEQPDAIYLQDADGDFTDVGEAWGAAQTGWSRGVVATDLNQDGSIDLVKRALDGGVTLLMGRPDHDHWLEIVPRGASVVVGAIVEVEAAGRTWRRWVLAGQDGAFCSGPPEVHVGLGSIDQVDRVRVRWPDGEASEVEDVAVDQRLIVER